NKSLGMGNTPLETLAAMTDAMNVVGEYYAAKKYFLPNVLTSANAFDKGFSLVQPKLLEGAGSRPKMAKVVIGVCEGDIHDIGKKIVVAMLRGGGFEVFDLGRDIPNQEFIDKAVEEKADIIAQSALMSTSITEMRDLMDLLKEGGIRDHFKVMIGGGSATPEFGQKIGVDGYGLTSAEAVEVAGRLSK
ncbi:MAG: cobalamin-dependent protein, partial [Methanomassiliicoccales archaeon]